MADDSKTTPDPHGADGESLPPVSQAEAIKALTHPLRVQLLDLFISGAELTATQCAERTGESVASCSFHLRQLEKYGHVQRADPRGKERPWKAAATGYHVRPATGDPESVQAAQAFASTWLSEQFVKMQRWVADVDRDDPEWSLASTQTSAEFWVTRDELVELSAQVNELAKKYENRAANPDLRPSGARRASFFGSVWAEIPDPASEDVE